MSEQIKKMNIKEFREKGYLQELNRQFLHPLGLALEILIEEDGSEKLGGIWDYREDEEGVYYAIEILSIGRQEEFINKALYVKEQWDIRESKRLKALGFMIEPLSSVPKTLPFRGGMKGTKYFKFFEKM